MITDILNKVKQEILNEATSEIGSRGSYIIPLRDGKRIFKKNQLGPFTDSVSKYYSQELATDSYDGEMSTPKKEIKKLETKAKKSSKSKNNSTFKKINEATVGIASGLYNGPIEIGMKKWDKNLLAPFTEFVDTEINHTKVKSKMKNNIERIVGMWEKDRKGSNNMDTHETHTINEWEYEEAPLLTEDLAVWFGTKKKPKGSKQPKGPWVDICRKVDGKHPPCGRSEGEKRAYPKCRAAGVAGKMSDSEKKAACAQKRRAEKKEPKYGTGNKPTMTSYKPKKSS
jgi:hypothetical protein